MSSSFKKQNKGIEKKATLNKNHITNDKNG
jgi:hypothetical protein